MHTWYDPTIRNRVWDAEAEVVGPAVVKADHDTHLMDEMGPMVAGLKNTTYE